MIQLYYVVMMQSYLVLTRFVRYHPAIVIGVHVLDPLSMLINKHMLPQCSF